MLHVLSQSQGASNRKVAATNMNRESSRSHSVFACTVESKVWIIEYKIFVGGRASLPYTVNSSFHVISTCYPLARLHRVTQKHY